MFLTRSSNCSPTLNIMITAVQKAARGIIRDFGEIEHLQVLKKGLGDFVSSADKKSEKLLWKNLKRSSWLFFLAEESGTISGKTNNSRGSLIL